MLNDKFSSNKMNSFLKKNLYFLIYSDPKISFRGLPIQLAQTPFSLEDISRRQGKGQPKLGSADLLGNERRKIL